MSVTPRRYDAILGVIPVAFLLAAIVAGATGISLQAALVGAATIGGLAIVDGVVRNPPTASGPTP